METAPPSYETATLVDVWQLVAPCLTTAQLCQASLVSKKWHRIFTAQLWGVPTSHFGLEFNGVLDHLSRYQKTLEFARLETRVYTYCLHLTPSQALYFDDRPAEWLKQLLERLPNLQALLVPGVSYFDHAACQALWDGQVSSKAVEAHDSFHRLRLLDASKCHNLTSVSLVRALSHLTSLVYLDLSYSHASRDRHVYRSMELLHALKVLKLRSTRLTDEDVQLLADAIRQRVFSLDLRDNALTDASIDMLIEVCFVQDGTPSDTPDEHIYQAYTTGSVNRLTIEDMTERGITSLRISGNDLSESSLAKLMSQRALRHLDIGTLRRSTAPQLMLKAGVRCMLKTLRVDHRVVRGTASKLYLPPALLSSVAELTLHGFPAHSIDQQTLSSLVDFIAACAHEAYIAASLASSDYTSPPGRTTAATFFALHTIVLELAASRPEEAVSLTGDHDSEAMWSAGQSDFSFFSGEADAHDIADYAFTKPQVDNLGLLSAFRNERRVAQQQAGPHSAAVPGFWPGTVRVQR